MSQWGSDAVAHAEATAQWTAERDAAYAAMDRYAPLVAEFNG